jgi:hypothetical protein
VVAVLAVSLAMQSMGGPIEVRAAISRLVHHPSYQVTVALGLLIVIRRALMRLEDIDVNKT